MNPRPTTKSESDRLWEALDKLQHSIEENAKETAKNTTAIAVLQLKASLWTIVGAFIATAIWFVKELFGGHRP